jgi:hypothetical protein
MPKLPPSGYSGTPLAQKLGFKPSMRVALCGAPDDYARLVEPVPAGMAFSSRPGQRTDMVHVFVVDRDALASRLAILRRQLRPDAAVWVSWPKKSSGMPSTVTEDVIRELAAPLGYVDVKVCAVTAVWSGLKLVVRKELR